MPSAPGMRRSVITTSTSRQPLDRLEPARRLDDVVALAAQQGDQHAPQVLLVVGDQDLGRLHRPLLYTICSHRRLGGRGGSAGSADFAGVAVGVSAPAGVGASGFDGDAVALTAAGDVLAEAASGDVLAGRWTWARAPDRGGPATSAGRSR